MSGLAPTVLAAIRRASPAMELPVPIATVALMACIYTVDIVDTSVLKKPTPTRPYFSVKVVTKSAGFVLDPLSTTVPAVRPTWSSTTLLVPPPVQPIIQ